MRDLLDQDGQVNVREEELKAFFGAHPDYFLGQWHLWHAGQHPSWNPAAFMLGICWFIYRQMWMPAAISLLVFWFLGLVEVPVRDLAAPEIPDYVFFAARLFLLHLLIGTFGNRIYLGMAQYEIENVKRKYPPGEVLRELRLRGGTSRLAVFIFLLMLLSITFCQIWGAPVGGQGRLFS
jgi:hypothetical protein